MINFYAISTERRHLQRKHLFLLTILMTLLLAACSSDEQTSTTVVDGATNITETDTTETTSTDTTSDDEQSTDNEANTSIQISPLCENITFKQDVSINGNALSLCMMDTMLAVKTGSHFVQSSASSSNVDFKFEPQFSMYVESDDLSVIIHDNTGWFQQQDGNWIEEDETSSDIEVVLATNVIKMTRAFSHPYTMTQYLAAVSEWKVVDFAQVPDSKAHVEKAWQLVPMGDVNFEGITLTDVELWITDEYLGAYYIATSTIAGMSETTSNTFTQWGGPVTIPEPF